MPKLSIIIPSYNHSNFLKQRLDSIVNQSFTDWQLIIIDDNSTDGSIEILKSFVKENKIIVKHFIINEVNSGSGYNSWKKGLELADTEYIWIAETDDYSESNFLEESIHILEKKPNCAFSFCSSVYVDEHQKKLYDSTSRTKYLKVDENEYSFFDASTMLDVMPFQPLITNGRSVVFRNPKLNIPSVIFENRQSSDIFLWTFLLKGKEFAFINKKMNYFRRHEGSTTTKTSKLKQESVYFEKAKYLNYFEQSDKHIEFINHYIKFYVNSNKSKMFNISSILKIANVKGLRFKYVSLLFKFYLNKIF
jgi:glycosyltransferase involved in cell wall biosynthesis